MTLKVSFRKGKLSLSLISFLYRAVGRSENLEGTHSNVVVILCPLVEIGLAVLQILEGTKPTPPDPPAPTALR